MLRTPGGGGSPVMVLPVPPLPTMNCDTTQASALTNAPNGVFRARKNEKNGGINGRFR